MRPATKRLIISGMPGASGRPWWGFRLAGSQGREQSSSQGGAFDGALSLSPCLWRRSSLLLQERVTAAPFPDGWFLMTPGDQLFKDTALGDSLPQYDLSYPTLERRHRPEGRVSGVVPD
jgi:hypothetical protein